MLTFLRSLFANREQSAETYGRSGKWPGVRARHLEREPACAACRRTADVEVHHIIPVAEALRRGQPELELDPTNLITLCADPCHLVHGHLMSFSRWSPSVRADCEAYRRRLDEAKARR